MNRATYLTRRNGRYYFRRPVPPALQPIVGKTKIQVALGTADPKEARRLVQEKAVEVDRLLRDARRQLVAGSAHSITPPTVQALQRSAADSAYGRLQGALANDPWWPHRRQPSNYLDPLTGAPEQERVLDSDLREIARPFEEVLEEGATRTRQPEVDEVVRDLLAGAGINEPEGKPDRAALRTLIAEGVLAGIKRFHDEVTRGASAPPAPRPGPPPAQPAEASQEDPALSLSDLFGRWTAERQPPEKTRIEFARAIGVFTETNGDLSVDAITKAHVRAFKEALQKRPGRNGPLSPASINKALGALSTVLSWAERNGYVQTNVASKMRVADPQADRDKRLPFEDEDLKAIFSGPVHGRGERPRAGAGEAAYWLPLLGLYTGARLEELGQLLATDVRRTVDGIDYIDINTLGAEKRLKTRGSQRKVPLHPELVRLGFLGYVEGIRKAGHERLFPKLNKDVVGTLTGSWSKWFGRYLRDEIGIEDRRKVFHSFRHTLKQAARRAQIPTDVHNALTGHAGQTVADSYGGEFPLEVLAQAVAKIRYGGMPRLDSDGEHAAMRATSRSPRSAVQGPRQRPQYRHSGEPEVAPGDS